MIYFIGAGPGAVDLITVRGMRLLEKASLVIYTGSLVNTELLEYCSPDCKLLDSSGMTMEQVISAIQEFPSSDTVVRLHTGDPSLFGAIREQMLALNELSLPYEIVPGVSAMNAAAAALHTEYTIPGKTQTVIISRMPGRTPVPEKENAARLAVHQASMIYFLSMNMLPELTRSLIQGGYSPETCAAVVYKASWPEQEIIRGTLADIAEKAAHIQLTGLVLIGDFLGDDPARSCLYDPHFSHLFRSASPDTEYTISIPNTGKDGNVSTTYMS